MLAHERMWGTVLVESWVSLSKHHTYHIIESMPRISLGWTLVNSLKWATQKMSHRHDKIKPQVHRHILRLNQGRDHVQHIEMLRQTQQFP